MRKRVLNFLLIGLLATLTMATSCSKDDDDNKPDEEENQNEFVISRSHTGVFDGEMGFEGELTINCNYQKDDLVISQIVVKNSISHFFGEITWLSVMKWEGTGTLYDFKWAAELLDINEVPIQHNGRKVYCRILGGTIPDAGDGFGWDVTGSPSWDEVFMYYNEETKELESGINTEDAQAIYKADFVLGNIVIIEINDEKI